jgi:hypothetical protein
MANGREYEAYREQLYYATAGMSHTLASRELVRQVPFQKRLFSPLYSLGDFVPLIPQFRKKVIL